MMRCSSRTKQNPAKFCKNQAMYNGRCRHHQQSIIFDRRVPLVSFIFIYSIIILCVFLMSHQEAVVDYVTGYCAAIIKFKNEFKFEFCN